MNLGGVTIQPIITILNEAVMTFLNIFCICTVVQSNWASQCYHQQCVRAPVFLHSQQLLHFTDETQTHREKVQVSLSHIWLWSWGCRVQHAKELCPYSALGISEIPTHYLIQLIKNSMGNHLWLRSLQGSVIEVVNKRDGKCRLE
jgi:hypothetical protein